MRKRAYNRREWLKAVAGTWAVAAEAAGRGGLLLVCTENNDLFEGLGRTPRRYDTAREAVRAARHGSAVGILADGYPRQTTPLDAPLLDEARRKRLRLYVEYPSWLPGQTVGAPAQTKWERGVIASSRFSPALPPMHIVVINGCHYVPAESARPDIVVARVAGFESALYGLPPKGVHPILFKHGDALLVAATKLSQFHTARYSPSADWILIWERILAWLVGEAGALPLHSKPAVHPALKPDIASPPGLELEAFRKGAAWYGNARLLVHPQWKHILDQAKQYHDSVGPAPKQDWPLGDGSLGMLEGFSSSIAPDGSQPARWLLRNDCMGESSFAFALAGDIENDAKGRKVAANLNNFIYVNSMLAGGPRANPASPSYGLVNWYTESKGVYYGDDNARSLLGTIGTAAVLKTDAWDKNILRCILGNFRTTGPLGFRGDRIDEPDLQKNGWRYYYERSRTHYAPHYEAYLWAVNLWAYHKTHYRPFLDRAKAAIGRTMEAYPQKWHWTNGLQQERARMLLPLAWLLRVDDTSEHRSWLRRMTEELLRFQVSSGAIREEIGTQGKGSYGPPASNEKYGTTEAPLIQKNGDPECDLLYTCNFAFLGLHEAAATTKEKLYSDAADKMADFFCRIQIRSSTHPELEGGWFRGFDYQLWDYWASNSDAGWGAWSIETGWTQAWITSVLGMRQKKTSLWDLTAQSQIGKWMGEMKPIFLPGDTD